MRSLNEEKSIDCSLKPEVFDCIQKGDKYMSASLVHFAVCDDASRIIGTFPKSFDRIKDALTSYPNFARLGSIGPDLPYYEKPVGDGLKMILDINIPLQASGYLLHTKTPNCFAARLFHIIEADGKDLANLDDAHMKLLAFALGYLTHMATDHVIHPYVNKKAGKYYVKSENQTKHRMIEIYQDVHLFRMQYMKDVKGKKQDVVSIFKAKNFEAKIDVPGESSVLGGFWDTQRIFRIFMQRAFLETFGSEVSEQNVEDWIDGAALALKIINKNVTPYTRALIKPDEALQSEACGGDVFYKCDDPIVSLATTLWKSEDKRRNTKKPAQPEMVDLPDEGENSSLYGKAIARSLTYITLAQRYLDNNESYLEFEKDLPGYDLSDPKSGG